MLKLVVLALTLITLSAQAGIIKTNAVYFNTVGSVAQFEWAPDSYDTDFKYDIVYYIPRGVATLENTPGLIFMHGGGDSTVTRQGSMGILNRYVNNMVKLAEALNMPVIIPSASGLNWGGHTTTMIRALAQLTRSELNIDTNRLALSGHSMGGMGITRAYHQLADEFSFFMPLSAGMDERIQIEERLNKVFDVPYVHIQGVFDEFQIFITRCQEQQRKIQILESTYGQNSLFELIFFQGGHQYDFNLVLENLRRLFQTPRNIYKTNLHGTLVSTDASFTEYGNTYTQKSSNRYFWVAIGKADTEKTESLDFRAKIVNNTISLDLIQKPEMIKSLRIYLSSNLLDLGQNVEVKLNGNLVVNYRPVIQNIRIDSTDPEFVFEDYIDIDI